MRDVETRSWDLFVFSSDRFLVLDEDIRYHPARIATSSDYVMTMKMNYHDVYREWVGNDPNDKTLYQYDVGLEVEAPMTLFSNNANVRLGFLRQTFSSMYTGEHHEAAFTGATPGTYSFGGALMFDGTPDKAGLRINYTTGTNRALINISQYPQDNTDPLLNTYFYDLLEPAFGNEIRSDVTEHEVSYALEYNRTITPSLNVGLNFYHEIDNDDFRINYYSSVQRITGSKTLDGSLLFKRYTLGCSCEYRFDRFILRSLATYSIPRYQLAIDQNHSLQSNNVTLEILHLSDGSCDGKGAGIGAGFSYCLKEGMSAGLSCTFIRNSYSGALNGSTPVLGFAILPIAHQLKTDFDDRMANALFSFVFNHEVSSRWKYSIGGEYLTSGNSIHYNYKILTEFGIGNTKEDNSAFWVVNIYKLDITSTVHITDKLGATVLFEQYIPVITNSANEGGSVNPSPSVETRTLETHHWGGSVYHLAFFWKFH